MAKKHIDTEQTLREIAEKLREAMNSIELHGDGEHDSTISNLCRVTTSLTTTLAELRQHDKAKQRALDEYPTEEILEHLRTRLRESDREEFAMKLSGADAEVGLL
jgi:hypothetical protein